MHAIMISRFAITSTLAAFGWAAPPAPSTTAALQTFLSISNLDASQAAEVSTKFGADATSYYSALTADPGYSDATSVIATAMPATAQAEAAANPELFLASLAKSSDDQPSWFTAMPTPVQAFWESAGSQYIDMYTSEVDAARPLPSSVSASLSSVSSKILSSASSAVSASASSAVAKGAAPASPATSGHMLVVAAGVAVAAGLVGMAML
ncbi:MAG: hypothetical protein Q9225_006364 [Loekoesia sp. 1 TL-2023]